MTPPSINIQFVITPDFSGEAISFEIPEITRGEWSFPDPEMEEVFLHNASKICHLYSNQKVISKQEVITQLKALVQKYTDTKVIVPCV